MALLSKFVVLKSVSSEAYVHYVADTFPEPLWEQHGDVQARQEHVFSPYAKIEVERAKVNTRFVHLRFCHSHKYWSLRGGGGGGGGIRCIVATSNQPVEDTSKWSCTMFEPTIGHDGFLYLLHVHSGRNVGTVNDATRSLYVNYDSFSLVRFNAFTFVDWDALVIMPKHVTFRGYNNKYLRSGWIQGHEYLQFASDNGNEEVTAYEVTMNPDGHIRIKSKFFGKFWRRSPNWIWADSTDTDGSNIDTLFWPIKVSDDVIALRNAGNGRFCKSLTADRKTDCLNAAVSTITKDARLQVEELVFERHIYDVVYLMDDAWIYDERPVFAGSGKASNNTSSEGTFSVKISYEDTSSYSFSNSLSVMLGVKTSIKTGCPRIAETGIEISAEVTNSLQWNRTTTVTKRAEATYQTVVPPMTEITVNYVATQGTCNIPFTHTQRDRLSSDGSFVTTRNNDGVYTGVNNYGFGFEQPAMRSIEIKSSAG